MFDFGHQLELRHPYSYVIHYTHSNFQVVICPSQVKIWEERRVFGSKAQNLKDIMLGDGAPPPLEFNKKRPRTVKIVRRDARSIRTVSPSNMLFSNIL